MKHILVVLSLLLACFSATAQEGGKVFDNLSLTSEILSAERSYSVYLPAGYDTSERSYPVLYLLHGSGDDHTGWIQFGEVTRITDKAIAEGCATPMIIVMPDADTKFRGYFNHQSGTHNFEDFFFEELIPHIEKTYRCRADKHYRAVAGLSMGGGGTLVYALRRPDLFAAACPLSAAVRRMTDEAFASRYMKSAGGKSEAEVREWYKNYDILRLVEQWPDENLKAVRWYIDCGDDDFLSEGNALLHVAMLKRGIPHEFRVRDGEHNWSYWRQALPEVLRFVSKSFHK